MWNLKNMSMTRSVTGTSKSLQVPIVWWEERSSQKNHKNHNNDNMFAKTKIHLKNKTSFDAQKQNSRERLITFSLSFFLVIFASEELFAFLVANIIFSAELKPDKKAAKSFFRETKFVRSWGKVQTCGLGGGRQRLGLEVQRAWV